MEVKLVGTGASDDVTQQVDISGMAARVSIRPAEWSPLGGQRGGHFRIGTMTGTMAAGIASGAQVFQLRWADTSRLFLLQNLTLQFATLTGFAATSVGCPVELIIGHGSTANGSGGTALTPSSIGQRMRTDGMASSSFTSAGEIRIATTAALTAATGQTLEAYSIGSSMGANNATISQTPPIAIYDQRDATVHPLCLTAGDTLVVRTVSPAATGTWTMSVSMSWMEAINF